MYVTKISNNKEYEYNKLINKLNEVIDEWNIGTTQFQRDKNELEVLLDNFNNNG